MFRGPAPLLLLLTTAVATGIPPAGIEAVGPGHPASRATAAPAAALPRPLPFFYDLYTFRGPTAGNTAVIAAFAVPVQRLERDDYNNQVRYRFDVTFVLADTAQRSVRRSTDSMFVAVPRPLGGQHLLYTQVQMLAPPSASTLQRVIMTDVTKPGIGQLYTGPFNIPDYSGSQLMISDIALGLPEETGGWKRGDVSLALLPTSQFPQGSFDLYYEIYNLPKRHHYETEITVEPLTDDGRPGDGNPVVTRFSGEAATRPDGILPELRRVDTRLPKGRYRITVAVTDTGTGQSATRSRILQVRGWEPGATLVPALPYRSSARPG